MEMYMDEVDKSDNDPYLLQDIHHRIKYHDK